MALGIAFIYVRSADLPDFLPYYRVSFAFVAQRLPIHKRAARDDVVNRRERVGAVVKMVMLHIVILQDMRVNGNDGLCVTISAQLP